MSGRIVHFPSMYEPEESRERPVPKQVMAQNVGVSTRTVDRWIGRDHMPEGTPEEGGCWIQAGAHRRFYASRVKAWLREYPTRSAVTRILRADRMDGVSAEDTARKLNQMGLLTENGREWTALAVSAAWRDAA